MERFDMLLGVGVVVLSVVMFLLGRLSMIPIWIRRREELEEQYRELDRLAEAEHYAMEMEYRREAYEEDRLLEDAEDELAKAEQAKWDRAEEQRDNEIYQERW